MENDWWVGPATLLASGAATFVLTLGGLAMNRLRQKWGLEATQINASNMEVQIQAALGYGIAQSLEKISREGWSADTVRGAVLTSAKHYFAERFPERTMQIVNAQNAGESAAAVSRALKATLDSRLDAAMRVAALSPSTPPAPPGAT